MKPSDALVEIAANQATWLAGWEGYPDFADRRRSAWDQFNGAAALAFRLADSDATFREVLSVVVRWTGFMQDTGVRR